ncbi:MULTISPECIES: hypothetical protein [unclassified Saccharopolyspora]|uniref:hypothetical protein n=1 Tax=unclassified Saccharopolyspora TaxID=2646250 RepID=UPI001CD41FC4|nr:MULTISPECIES: hypothetical protein [unclassified Saccharopolyspora]MCA1191535.1 hypothetical protein [Saccharopolyspora sp. 6V]MCA1280826.1 hypothetical protein [Saccharopolyspora sp. 7B]
MTSAVPDEAALAELVGTEFPGGEFTVEPWWVRLVNDCALADPDDGAGSPVFAFLAATSAMGVSWERFWGWFGARESDGPMAGEVHTVLHRPLRVGATYAVRGRIESARRKRGARTGVFDLVEYRLDLHEPDGSAAASCTSSILFPRRPR